MKIGENILRYSKGSPQGGIISPILWLVYINSLLIGLEQKFGVDNTFAYVDDLMNLVERKNRNDLIDFIE